MYTAKVATAHSTWQCAINAATARRIWKHATTNFVSAHTPN